MTTLRVDASALPWSAEEAGVAHKLLAPADEQDPSSTSLVRLAPGAALPAADDADGREFVVLEGELRLEGRPLAAGGYARQPAGSVAQASTDAGCVLYMKEGPHAPEDTAPAWVPEDATPWLPGQGGLTVKPLHQAGSTGTAFVHWPAGERFLPHRHWGGEEIYVLSGTFRDEHGAYPAGTWIRSPHLSEHHPFVVEETVIFVKTGHLRAQ